MRATASNTWKASAWRIPRKNGVKKAAAGSSHGRLPRRSTASRHPSLIALVLAWCLGPRVWPRA